MNPHLTQVRDIFDRVSDLPPGDRAEPLGRLCPDAAIRAEVESLLRSHDAQGLMSAPTIAAPPGAGLEGPGTVIGPYKLLQTIGEGGFGIVYMAEQERPVRRKVALKIIKLGMDTRQVIARFEAERQALAMMDHPNIARVLDAGATEAGRPYFVMELVRGVPITEYCDTNKLSPRDRLELFIQVCHAVQHAHQKGVIHRDLKPSNVLVTLHDGKPVPKVIDFGIAKATSQRLTDKTLFTEFRQFIGTPEYMSPEQAEMSGLDVDTRADIYSLGVLLYELLTGTTPFEAHTLRNQALDRIQRIIRETDPPLPSTRVGALTSTAARTGIATPTSASSAALVAPSTATTADDIARHRRTDPASLGRILKGDLDWIVMKAIEKDRTRRYETATALAADVVRYLSDEPVEAGPPSSIYRLRKFAKRNRVWIATTCVAAAAFTLAFVGVLYGLLEARAGRADAVEAQGEAEQARSQAQEALDLARRESQRNAAISQYLQDAVAGRRAGAEDVPLEEILGRGRELFAGDHAVVGSALMAWASSRQLTGDAPAAERALDEAAAMLARMHGPGDARSWNARLLQARAIADQAGREAQAESLFREVIRALRASPGPGSADHAVALEALTSHLLSTAGTTRNDEIALAWRETVEAYETAYGPMDRRTIREMAQFGQWMALRSIDTPRAVALLEESVRRGEQVFPEGDSSQFMAINSLILVEYTQNANFLKAARWYDRLVEMGDRMGGEYAKGTAAMRFQIAGFYANAGQPDLAVERLRQFVQAVEQAGEVLGWEASMRIELSFDWVEALLERDTELGRRIQLIRAAAVGEVRGGLATPPSTTLHMAGQWLERHGFASDAEPILARALVLRREAVPADLAGLADTLSALGRARIALARYDEAQANLREALAIRQAALGARSPAAHALQFSIAECLIAQGRRQEAVVLLEDWAPPTGSSQDLVEHHARVRGLLGDGDRPG